MIMLIVLQSADCDDLPEECDPHYELRLKLRSAIEREHERAMRRQSNVPQWDAVDEKDDKQLDRVFRDLSVN